MVNERSSLLEKQQPIPRHLTARGIADEIANLSFAGTDTTSITLAYLFWDLAHQSHWQAQLREELKEKIGESAEFDFQAISELPILEAVVQESLRLRPVAPASLPRLAPDEGVVIDGTSVPAGVRSLTPTKNIFFPNPIRRQTC